MGERSVTDFLGVAFLVGVACTRSSLKEILGVGFCTFLAVASYFSLFVAVKAAFLSVFECWFYSAN